MSRARRSLLGLTVVGSGLFLAGCFGGGGPAPAPQPSAECHPNYSPCVPIGSDADCAGGSGDGPIYVSGPVQIIGGDPYQLDADGDGLGCE